MTGSEVDDAAATKETPDAAGRFPGLEQFFARQAGRTTRRSSDVIEQRIPGKAAEVVLR